MLKARYRIAKHCLWDMCVLLKDYKKAEKPFYWFTGSHTFSGGDGKKARDEFMAEMENFSKKLVKKYNKKYN